MPRHSKHSCAAPVFTPGERAKLNYGTQEKRMTGDSFKDFDACDICLHTLEDPLVCTKGHMFCKGCVYENLLAQKDHMKRQTKAFEEQALIKESKNLSSEEAKKMKQIEQFEKSESSVTSQGAKKNGGGSGAPIGYVAVTLEDGKTSYVPDKSFVKAHMVGSANLSEEKRKERAAMLPSFWVPSLTPDEGAKTVQKPAEHTSCPAGGHMLRLKQLRPIKFTIGRKEEGKNNGSAQPQCSSCSKTFTKASKAAVLRGCGHVVCTTCVDTFIQKEGLCVECNAPVVAKDIVKLESGGTSFAAGGAQTVKSLQSPAFMTF